VAALQVVVCVVRDGEGVVEAARGIVDALAGAGARARLDDRTSVSFGRRATDWEIKGVPVRVEIGPRDLAEGTAAVVRRGSREKTSVALGRLPAVVTDALDEVQTSLLAAALERRDSRTAVVSSLDEAIEATSAGFARIPWRLVGEDGEARLAGAGVSVRCLQRPDGSLPEGGEEDEPELDAVVARAY
jgi:prolyl-tRNA synthetase